MGQTYFFYLNILLRDYIQDISNADFWQIAGIAALELASNNGLDIEFKGGRVDCPHSPSEVATHEFPEPNMNRNDMMNWFKNNDHGFHMDENQVGQYMYFLRKKPKSSL